jgi:tRNA-intron endonuclease
MQQLVTAVLVGSRCVTEHSGEAQALFKKSRFGSLRSDNRVELSGFEALFLAESGRIAIQNSKGKQIASDVLHKKIIGSSKQRYVQYAVFADMRKRGYVVKTALKFGADFRVYDRGSLPGDDHARWVLFAVHEHDKLTWHSFAAKSRVAHSTKKGLLIGVVDDEGDITYWDVGWLRP